MKYIMTLFVMLCGVTAQAQEYEIRAEFMACKLNEGKTLRDAMEQSRRYGEFSAAAGTQYMQAILTPIHAGDTSAYDYLLWGQWPSGQAMYEEWGNYTNEFWRWMAEQEEPMEPAGSCNWSVAMFNTATAHSRIPVEERDLWQPHQFADCKLQEGATLEQVVEMQARHGEMMKEAGFAGWGTHIFTPYLGFDPQWPYDFVQMNHWYNFAHRGQMADNWLAFLEKHPEVQSETDALVSCERDRSFAVQLIFNNQN